MMKANVNIDGALKKLARITQLSNDMRPVLEVIRGVPADTNPYTVIGGINTAFATQSQGSPWKELNADYFKRKQKKYPGTTTLIRTRKLYQSLVTPGADGNVEILDFKKLVYGTVVPYAGYHQSTGSRKKLPRRPFLDLYQLPKPAAKLIKAYLADTKDWETVSE